MELGPILRTIAHNRIAVTLLVAEIAVTLAIVLNGVNIAASAIKEIGISSGLDENNIVVAGFEPYGENFETEAGLALAIKQDLAQIRNMTGVRQVTVVDSLPLAGGPTVQLKPMGAPDSSQIWAYYYVADENFIEALGLELVEGRAFTPEEIHTAGALTRKVIITEALADQLFSTSGACGRQISRHEQAYEVVGVVRHMHNAYLSCLGMPANHVSFYPGFLPGSALGGTRRNVYVVRTTPGSRSKVLGQLESTLLGVNSERVVAAHPLEQIKAHVQGPLRLVTVLMLSIVLLLLALNALGIYAMTCFVVTERTHQIGIRRALGAGRADIVRYFLLESSITIVLGAALGLIGAEVLSMALVNAGVSRGLAMETCVLGVALVWGVGLMATLPPAVRGANVAPVVATKSA